MGPVKIEPNRNHPVERFLAAETTIVPMMDNTQIKNHITAPS
jgi:hypothetical protein